MAARLRFLINRLKERLWIRPLAMCLLSLVGAMAAKSIEYTPLARHIPTVGVDSLGALLTTLSASMLVIATFAVGSMVASYAAASGIATPRAFPLVVADDVSQNALSSFIGAFIYSVLATVFLKEDFYRDAGRSVLFVLTLAVFALVILTFVRWVDSIARLGRMVETISKVESVTATALKSRRLSPTLNCAELGERASEGVPVYADSIGYVQRINVDSLQTYAAACGARVTILALPGTFTAPGRVLAEIRFENPGAAQDPSPVREAFVMQDGRTFDEDPRFGLIVLSEIAGRALSPAVNDPGTAIGVTGTLVRLLTAWARPPDKDELKSIKHDRVEVPRLSAADMFDDAFTAIARDGAGSVEVAARLQKALAALATLPNPEVRAAAIRHSRMALARAERALTLPEDLRVVQGLAAFSADIAPLR